MSASQDFPAANAAAETRPQTEAALRGKMERLKTDLAWYKRATGFDLDGPCPICNGTNGCSHTISERFKASQANDRGGHRTIVAGLVGALRLHDERLGACPFNWVNPPDMSGACPVCGARRDQSCGPATSADYDFIKSARETLPSPILIKE